MGRSPHPLTADALDSLPLQSILAGCFGRARNLGRHRRKRLLLWDTDHDDEGRGRPGGRGKRPRPSWACLDVSTKRRGKLNLCWVGSLARLPERRGESLVASGPPETSPGLSDWAAQFPGRPQRTPACPSERIPILLDLRLPVGQSGAMRSVGGGLTPVRSRAHFGSPQSSCRN